MSLVGTLVSVQHPITGELVVLDTPMFCEDMDDVEWLKRTWGAVMELEWRITCAEAMAKIPAPPPSRANPDLIGWLEL